MSDHVDGDTMRVVPDGSIPWLGSENEITVRLLEIDTPESVDPSSPLECYSRRATRRLGELAPLGSKVWVLPDQDLRDPYGRTLLYIWNARGRFVNLAMVREGYAKAALYEPNDAYITVMRRAEAKARRESRGLWDACESFGAPAAGSKAGARGPSPSTPSPRSSGLDPRFSYCSEATEEGFGTYVDGRDPEYSWYDDADGDGVVCEF